VLCGYFLNLLIQATPTPSGFVFFTLANGLYLLVAWLTFSQYRRKRRADYRVALGVGLINALAISTSFLIPLGMEFDGLLFFATIAITMTILPTRIGLAVTALLYISLPFLAFMVLGSNGLKNDWLALLAGFVFVAGISYSNRLLATERERSRLLFRQLDISNRELEAAHLKLQEYTNQVEELTVARERTRLAREIHDTLGHYLTILSIQLETIGKLQEKDPARAATEIVEAKHVATQSMQEVRNVVAALRPSAMGTLKLPEALVRLGEEFRRATGEIELTLDLETEVPAIAPDLQLTLYRVAQESLTNVRKHACASKVLLRMRYENDAIELVVLDNGQGAPFQARHGGTAASASNGLSALKGFGLLGLRERAELLGGTITHGNAEPRGYRVTVRLPVRLSQGELNNPAGLPSVLGGEKP
jgi:signal transduction histidine kinase